MAENLQVPHAKTPLLEGEMPAKPWFTLWSLTGKRLTGLAGISKISTADATDPASTMALVNEMKAKLNAILDTQK